MTDDPNEISRRLSNKDAAQLLLAAAPAFATGATILSPRPDSDVAQEAISENQLCGLAFVDEKHEVGEYILASKNRFDSFDNQTRWTLIDSGKLAKIILEVEELRDERYVMWKGVVSFDYPEDRTALFLAAQTGWLGLACADRASASEDELRSDTAKSLMALQITTGPQLGQMLKIMDDRNPELERLTVNSLHEMVTGKPYRPYEIEMLEEVAEVSNRHMQDETNEEVRKELGELLRSVPKPLAATLGIYELFAINRQLDFEMWKSTARIAEETQIEVHLVTQHLQRVHQSDTNWVQGRVRGDGEWEWKLNETVARERFTGLEDPINTEAERDKAARKLLEILNVPIPIEEISPAIAMMEKIGLSEMAAEAYISLLHKKTPVWSGARGYALAYEEMLRRVRLFKELGYASDDLTILHCQVGASMHDSHVLTVASEQAIKLPALETEEVIPFLRGTPLPFNPFFIDFSGDEMLPHIDTPIAREGNAKLLGTLLVTGTDDDDEGPQVLYATPVFVYSSIDSPVTGPVVLGSAVINLTEDPSQPYWWTGNEHRFPQGYDAMTVLAGSDYLNKTRELQDAYQGMINKAVGTTFAVLHLLDYSNIEMVPKPLERRDRKRAEKRNWDIPLVVRVSRPSRRVVDGHSDGMGSVEFSHQFDVIGHPKHFTKGPMVSCLICQGKDTEDGLTCPRCQGTGLDPEKVRPCTRIDVATNEKTCPDGCRRIWCPPYVKGPEDKPYVPKVRKLT